MDGFSIIEIVFVGGETKFPRVFLLIYKEYGIWWGSGDKGHSEFIGVCDDEEE